MQECGQEGWEGSERSGKTSSALFTHAITFRLYSHPVTSLCISSIFFFFFAAPRDMQDPNSPTRNWTCAPCSAVRSPNRRTTGEVPQHHALNNETGFRKMEQSTQVPQVELIHFDDFKAHTLVLTALDLAHSRRPSKKMTHMYPLPPGKKSSHVLLYKYYSEQDHQNTHLFLSKDHFQASSSCLF